LPNEMLQHIVAALKHPELFIDRVNCAILRENGVLPINKTKAPLPDVGTSSKGLFQEESGLPRVRTSDGFDLNAYKLMKKSDYDFSKPPPLGNVIEEARPRRPMTPKK